MRRTTTQSHKNSPVAAPAPVAANGMRVTTKLKLFSGSANPVRGPAAYLCSRSNHRIHRTSIASHSVGRLALPDVSWQVPHIAPAHIQVLYTIYVQALSQEVAAHLGLQLGPIRIKRFADGEIYVQVKESIRGCDVFLLQPTCPTDTASVNDSLMELMVMVDACRCVQHMFRNPSDCFVFKAKHMLSHAFVHVCGLCVVVCIFGVLCVPLAQQSVLQARVSAHNHRSGTLLWIRAC